MECISCKTECQMTIKNVNFCNKCFTNKFIRKVRQVINTLPQHTSSNNFLLIVSGTKNSLILFNIINEICKYRKQLIDILTFNKDCFSYLKNLGANPFFKEIKFDNFLDCREFSIEYAKNNKYQSIITEENLDDLSVNVLELIFKGEGNSAINYVANNVLGEFRPFAAISQNEIEIFEGINDKVPDFGILFTETRIRSETINLMNNLNDKNYSTSYNILGTLKKLKK